MTETQLPQKATITDPEQKEFDLKIMKAIDEMPAEVKDRFKALKVLEVLLNDLFCVG